MKRSLMIGAVITSMGWAAFARSSMQPPMNSLNDAYYTCDGGAAFLMEYDANPPQNATMTTSDNNHRYGLARSAVSPGVEFASGRVKFWTDGKAVRVDGTTKTYRNCKLKPN